MELVSAWRAGQWKPLVGAGGYIMGLNGCPVIQRLWRHSLFSQDSTDVTGAINPPQLLPRRIPPPFPYQALQNLSASDGKFSLLAFRSLVYVKLANFLAKCLKSPNVFHLLCSDIDLNILAA